MREIMKFDEWLKSVPAEIAGDLLWKVEAYRLALFLADLAWHDVTKFTQDKRMFGLADRLYRAVGSMSANISEGYSRSSGKTAPAFMNMPSAPPAKTGAGFTKAAMCLERMSPNIGSG